MTSTGDFEAYVLSRIARNPSLAGETARSLRVPVAASADAVAPSTLDDAHRALLAPFLVAPSQADNTTTAAGSSSSSSDPSATASATMALLQRVVVDTPLLPMGGEHLLYDSLFSAFVNAATAARALQQARACKTKALQQQQQQQQSGEGSEGGDANGSGIERSGSGTTEKAEASPLPSVAELDSDIAEAAEQNAAARAGLARAFGKVRWVVAAMSADGLRGSSTAAANGVAHAAAAAAEATATAAIEQKDGVVGKSANGHSAAGALSGAGGRAAEKRSREE